MSSIRARFKLSLLLSTIVCSFCVSSSGYADTPALSVVGNKVLTSSGQSFIPEGISVYGDLEAPNYNQNRDNDYAQITAAAKYWHANTIRFQVAESNLFSGLKRHETYNHKFLADLNKQVNYARGLHLVVVINDQTEFTSRIPAPTSVTKQFWAIMSSEYKSQPGVIFDIFNEPRLTPGYSIVKHRLKDLPFVISDHLEKDPITHKLPKNFSLSSVYSLWKNGGNVNGQGYLGMQAIVTSIRSNGANNIIWVEGAFGARTLPPNNYLLRGSNLVYDIHHPNLDDPKSWKRIGSLAAIRPVVDGEWAQYQSNWPECFSDAPTNVPRYLSYLHKHSVGLVAWSLQSNVLLAGDGRIKPSNLNRATDPNRAADLKNPSSLTTSYNCQGVQNGAGVGKIVMSYFAHNSYKYSL